MARKRASELAERSDEDNSDAHVPSSPKRARREQSDAPSVERDSQDGENGDDAMEEDDEDDEEEQTRDMQVDEDDETLEERIRSKLASQRPDTDEAQSGILTNIELVNFMNHTLFELKLGPRVNFVVGRNGTGKSAILTGLVIGLGGGARFTERGKSLASLIKNGQDRAEIRIKIKNKGDNAFKRDSYGDVIIVERILNRTGTNTLRLKSAKGSVVATKKANLIEMLDHHQILIENPMSILMQDAAKAFLSASTPKDKYQSFLNGTMLQHLADEYARIRNTIRAIQSDLKKAHEDLPRLKQDKFDAKSRYNRMKAIEEQEARKVELINKIAWAYVQEMEQDLEHAINEREAEEMRVSQIVDNVNTAEDERQAIVDQIEEVEGQKAAHNEMDTTNKQRVEELGLIIEETRAEIRSLKDQISDISSTMTADQAAVATLDKKIKDEQERLHKNASGAAAAKSALVEQLESEHAMMLLEQAGLQQELQDLESRDEATRADSAKLRQEVAEKKTAVDTLQNRLQTAQNNRTNPLAGYPQQMGELLQRIRSRQWRGNVVGPLGLHAKLRDPAWSQTLEAVFREELNHFIVTDEQDRVQLMRMVHETGMRVSVIKKQRVANYNFQGGMPEDRRLTTILSVMTFDDELVRNYLIDNNRIESSILVKTAAEGFAVMRGGGRGVSNCYSKDLFRLTGGQRGSGQHPMSKWDYPARLTNDTADYVRRVQAEHREAEAALLATRPRDQALGQELRAISDLKQTLLGKLRSLTARVHRKNAEISRARLDLQDAQDDQPSEVEALMEKRKEYEDKIQDYKAQFEAVASQRNQTMADLKPSVEERMKLRTEAEAHAAVDREFDKQLSHLEAERQKAEITKAHWVSSKQRQEQAVTARTIVVDQKTETLGEKISAAADATGMDERPPGELKSAKTYQTELAALEKNIKDVERREGNITLEQALELLHAASITYENANKELDSYNRFCEALKASLAKRINKWELFRKFFTILVKNAFTENMAARRFQGTMVLDHDNKTLTLDVQTDESQGSGGRTDTRSLSGGEKSFSTVSLLLAMWSVISAKIRCLDEFDVFMDQVNRRIAVKQIVEMALHKGSTQHLFISPNSLHEHLANKEGVRVVKLTDNERGQGVIRAFAVFEDVSSASTPPAETA